MEEVQEMWKNIIEHRKKNNIVFYRSENESPDEIPTETKIRFLCHIVKRQKKEIESYKYLIESYRELLKEMYNIKTLNEESDEESDEEQ